MYLFGRLFPLYTFTSQYAHDLPLIYTFKILIKLQIKVQKYKNKGKNKSEIIVR